MFISPKFAVVAAAPFTLFCLGFSVHGFLSTAEISDPQQLADARGYALFWLFLAAVAIVSGVLSWWIMSAQQRRERGDA